MIIFLSLVFIKLFFFYKKKEYNFKKRIHQMNIQKKIQQVKVVSDAELSTKIIFRMSYLKIHI